MTADDRAGDSLDGGSLVADHQEFLSHPAIEPHGMAAYVADEARAEGIESYDRDFVPGLLQVRPYIEAVAEVVLPMASGATREEFVAFRQARQKRLAGAGSPRFTALIHEDALQGDMPTPVLRKQLQALVDAMRRPSSTIEIRIVPRGAAVEATDRSLVLMSLPEGAQRVYRESAESTTKDEGGLQEARDEYAKLEKAALTADRSLAHVEQVLAELS